MDLNKLKFAKTHEWISPDGTVGISDHAQKEITDVVFVDLPAVGKQYPQGTEAGTVESVKAAFPIYAPVAGKIVSVNDALGKDPALVNQSPYEKGWFFKIALTNPTDLDTLMTHDEYQTFLKSETH